MDNMFKVAQEKPSVVLVQVSGLTDDLEGIEYRPLEPEAPKHHINPGKQLVGKANKVRIGEVISRLNRNGLKFREAFWRFRQDGKQKRVYTFVFARVHDKPPIDIPVSARDILNSGVFNILNAVWANPREDAAGNCYRMDAILAAGVITTKPPAFNLRLNGIAYSLVEAEK
jgi:hypothetical protein